MLYELVRTIYRISLYAFGYMDGIVTLEHAEEAAALLRDEALAPKEMDLRWKTFEPGALPIFFNALKENQSLKVVDLGWVTPIDSAALTTHIERNQDLRVLTLAKNALSSDEVIGILQALEKPPMFLALELNHFELGVAGGAALARFITNADRLKILHLINVKIPVESVPAIFTALSTSETLKELDFSDNPLGQGGVDALAELLQDNKTLQFLDIRHAGLDNSIDTSSIWKVLETNTTLEAIDLSWNARNLSVDGLIEALQHNFKLKEVHGVQSAALEAILTRNRCLEPAVLLLEVHALDSDKLKIEKVQQVLDVLATYNPDVTGTKPYKALQVIAELMQVEQAAAEQEADTSFMGGPP